MCFTFVQDTFHPNLQDVASGKRQFRELFSISCRRCQITAFEWSVINANPTEYYTVDILLCKTFSYESESAFSNTHC